MIDSQKMRGDFPVFAHHPDLVYLDSAATALKPRVVIEKECEYMETYPANISRGLYALSERATAEYEMTRSATAEWIGAQSNEVVFTKGTTESLNLLAYALEGSIAKGDAILVTAMDHHANFLPWQALAKRTGATFRIIPILESGDIDLEVLAASLDANTKIFAFPSVSNVLGSVTTVRAIADIVRARAPQARIILDAAQAASHIPIDVQTLGVDFLAFSAHKCFGPTGVGVLWGKYSLLESLSPFQYGGDMVESARAEGSLFKKPPHRFEAGTPNISGIIAFRAAIEYMQALGIENIHAHASSLTQYALTKLRSSFPDIYILGPNENKNRGSLISFTLPGIHPHDLAASLAEENICIRAGSHCAHPLHHALDIPATARMSFSIYNSEKDVDCAIEGVEKARKIYAL